MYGRYVQRHGSIKPLVSCLHREASFAALTVTFNST